MSYAVRDYTLTSSYVLNRGTFSLRYGSLGIEYAGTYRQEGNRIDFIFGSDGRWDAVGTIDGDALEVRYNIIMEMSDFENAVYRPSSRLDSELVSVVRLPFLSSARGPT